jgi:hypothetical protein
VNHDRRGRLAYLAQMGHQFRKQRMGRRVNHQPRKLSTASNFSFSSSTAANAIGVDPAMLLIYTRALTDVTVWT